MVSKKEQKRRLRIFAFTMLILGLGVGGYLLVVNLPTLLGTAEEAFEEPTDYEFLVLDYVTNDEIDDDDHNIYVYRASIDGLTQEEIDDLEFDDYVLDETKDTGETYEPDLLEYTYWVIANGSDFWEWQVEPVLGLNTIWLMNKSADVSMAAYSKDELNVTIVNSTFDKWTILTQTLNGTEGDGNVTTVKEGFKPYFDFRQNKDVVFVINITLNTTAELAYVDYDGDEDSTIKASGNDLLIEVNATLLGLDEFPIDFNSDIGSIYVPQSIGIGWGHSGDYNEWDTQS